VVDVASRLIAAEGFEQVTIRSVARELGVSPMSLYRHVESKDDLLAEVVDRLLARAWRPTANNADWRPWVAEAAGNLRTLLVDQPAALHVFLRHPVTSAAALERMDAIMAVLRRVLPDERSAREAYAAVHTYTIGFAALQASRNERRESAGPGTELADQLARFASPEQFSVGLSYLLDGIVTQAL
jgi:AcrR family transcriptional regulator